jgi:damage-control phosphatase, subfamily III
MIQSGLATQIHFHGKRFAWFVSDVTRKDWNWLMNSMVYGQLFPGASEVRCPPTPTHPSGFRY